MNGNDFFLDTNICIYLLNGDSIVAELLQDQNIFISVITEMELYAFHGNNQTSLDILDSFIESVSIIDIDKTVKAHTIAIRKNIKLKLPDCIIAASAITHKMPLISADKGLKKVTDIDLVFYEKQ